MESFDAWQDPTLRLRCTSAVPTQAEAKPANATSAGCNLHCTVPRLANVRPPFAPLEDFAAGSRRVRAASQLPIADGASGVGVHTVAVPAMLFAEDWEQTAPPPGSALVGR